MKVEIALSVIASELKKTVRCKYIMFVGNFSDHDSRHGNALI